MDWYWQRQSNASLPRRAVLLFDKSGIPQDMRQEQLDPQGTPLTPTEQERRELATQRSTFFWAMSNIAVKSILRHQAWAAVKHIDTLRWLVDEMKRLVGGSTTQEGQEEWRTSVLPPIHRDEQMPCFTRPRKQWSN